MINLLQAEWVKLRTVTSHWVLVLIGVAFTPAVAIPTAIFLNEVDVNPDTPASVTAGTTVVLSLLFACLGVLAFAQEHSHGTIRVTYAAEPRRTRVLVAKGVVLVLTSAAVAAVTVYVTFFTAVSILQGREDFFEFTGPGAHREVLVGSVVLSVLLALFGYAGGLLLRNAPAAITILIVWVLLAEGLLGGLLSLAFGDGVFKFMPYQSGVQMILTEHDSDYFSRPVGGLYFAAWVLALLALGIFVNNRRDA